MAKIQRVTGKIFGGTATATGTDPQIGQFGSALAGTYVGTTDISTIQQLPAWGQGFIGAVTTESQFPALPEVTGFGKVLSQQQCYILQQGVAEWDSETTYYDGSFCSLNRKLYVSLIDENINNNPETDTENWQEASGGGAGLEIGDIGIAPLGIDETQGKRRYLNGQIIIQEQYQVFADKVKSAIVLYPNIACSEEDWQATVTLSAFGQCGKFVVDDTAGTIRLPKITGFIQGLNDLASLGSLVEAGLPNITGTWYSSTEDTYFFEPTGAIYRNNLGGDGSAGAGGHFDRMYIDASRSSSIYGNSDTVQPESIRYPYFIQVATGSETEDNIINEIELNNPYTLFDNKYAEAPLYNVSWLYANGTFNGSNAVHPSAYQGLLIENNADIEVGTTVNNYTKRGLSVKLSTDTYTDYDFVVNTADETFRLPIKTSFADNNVADLYLYFYVGETVQNANLINAGRIEEKLADKVDTSNTQWAISACMPDYSAGTTLSLTTGTIFNVPYDCMIYLKSTGSTAGGISLKLDNANGLEILGFASATVAVVAVATLYFAKDTKIYVSSIGNLATSLIYPLKGAN